MLGAFAPLARPAVNMVVSDDTGPRIPATTVELDAVVPAEFRGGRVDRVAVALFAEQAGRAAVSRSEVARWLRDGSMTVDGRTIKPKTPVHGGERIRVRAVRLPRVDWNTAQDVAFAVVYEDASLVVVDKPAGLVVHPGAGNADGTLVNGLLKKRPELVNLPRAGLVQRLDKDTSGLMVVAAERASRAALTAAMAARRIERRYLAVVEGPLIAGRRIEASLGRDPNDRKRVAVRADGRPAVTHVGVRERFAAHTFVEARLETGRTHQIRVHLASIGHPLVGDRRYGARGVVPRAAGAEAAAVVKGFPRQALHAWRLSFEHPETGRAMDFESALPDDMAGLLAALRDEPALRA